MKNNIEISLKNREWKEFEIQRLFCIKIGKNVDGNKVDKTRGEIAYITRKENNNGLDGFINFDNSFLNKDNPVITIGNETAEPFVQPYEFFTGTKVNILIPRDIKDIYILKFIATSLRKHKGKYSYSFTINSTRLKRQKILLPVNSKGEPDYEFMEQYMRAKEQENIKAYKNYISKRIKELENVKPVVPLKEKQWAEFFIEEVAKINSGKDIYKAERIKGDIPYISSTAQNNGIGYFVGNTNKTLEANCLSVNRNGSVGYSFYHYYPALFSNDCRKLRLKYPSKYVGIFISQQITRQRKKYGYGYKMGTARLKRQKILLPINENKEPDYEFMENYMKRLELVKLKKYLDYKEKKVKKTI